MSQLNRDFESHGQMRAAELQRAPEPSALEQAKDLTDLQQGRSWQVPLRSAAAPMSRAGTRVVLIHHRRETAAPLDSANNWLRLD